MNKGGEPNRSEFDSRQIKRSLFMTRPIRYTSTRLSAFTGFFVQAIVNNFLPILFVAFQDVYGIGYEKLGRLIAVNFITQLFTDILTPKIVSRLGYRKTAVLCQGLAAFGLLSLSVLPRLLPDPYIGIMFSIVIYAFASGLMEVILSPMIEILPTDNQRGTMCFLHSFYCWGQAITAVGTTLLLQAFGFVNWAYIPAIWAVIPFLNMLSFCKVPVLEPEREQTGSTLKELLALPKFRCFMVMMLCAGAAEIAMAQWASLFAQRALGVSKTVGDLAGPCAFALFMGTGRVLYGAFASRLSFRKTVLVTSALCAASYLISAFASLPALSLLSCALCGFSVSIFWPGTYSQGATAFPRGGALMYSVFAMCGDLGCCLGPWLIGVIADVSGLQAGLAVNAVFPVILFFAVLLFLRENNDCNSVKNHVQ